MRFLYLVLGLLAGINFTTNQSLLVINVIEERWEKDILAFTLTGYSEGWSRGREYADSQNRWMYLGCLKELNRAYKKGK